MTTRRTPSADEAPLVTVVVPFFNLSAYLEEALAGVAAQTVTGIETILVDDGSEPAEAARARELSDRYGARYVRQENAGLSAARNKGISLARAPYVLPLDADDRIAPTMVEKTLWFLAARPRLGYVSTGLRDFGARNGFWMEQYDPYVLCLRNLACVASMIRKAALDDIGGYDETMNRGYEDWNLWVSFLEKGWRGALLAEHLYEYRIRPGSMYSHSLEVHDELVDEIRLRHRQLYSMSPQFRLWLEHICRWKAEKALARFRSAVGGHRTYAGPAARLRRFSLVKQLRARMAGRSKEAVEALDALSRNLKAAHCYRRKGVTNVLGLLDAQGPELQREVDALRRRFPPAGHALYILCTRGEGETSFEHADKPCAQMYILGNFLPQWAQEYFVEYYRRTRASDIVVGNSSQVLTGYRP